MSLAPTTTAFVGATRRGPIDAPVHVRSPAEFSAAFGGWETDSPLSIAVHLYFENGGAEAVVLRLGAPGALTDAHVSAPALQAGSRGLWALERAGAFHLLCVPPFAAGPGGDIGAATRQAAAAYCRARRAMFIADPLSAWLAPSDPVSSAHGVDSAAWGLDRTENAAL
jgi:hypothetical protein